jgi:hypothetical protein
MKQIKYYVYAHTQLSEVGILNLWALVYTTTDKIKAKEVKDQYPKSKILLSKMYY